MSVAIAGRQIACRHHPPFIRFTAQDPESTQSPAMVIQPGEDPVTGEEKILAENLRKPLWTHLSCPDHRDCQEAEVFIGIHFQSCRNERAESLFGKGE
jgi:hypothetical protein